MSVRDDIPLSSKTIDVRAFSDVWRTKGELLPPARTNKLDSELLAFSLTAATSPNAVSSVKGAILGIKTLLRYCIQHLSYAERINKTRIHLISLFRPALVCTTATDLGFSFEISTNHQKVVLEIEFSGSIRVS